MIQPGKITFPETVEAVTHCGRLFLFKTHDFSDLEVPRFQDAGAGEDERERHLSFH
jgi:hypothetical protein